MIRNFLYTVKRPFHLVKTGLLKGLPAEFKYKHPARELKIITITGTDGKTTSSTMLYHVLKTAGKKVALLSTVAAYIGEEEIDTGFHVTTPQPDDIHQMLRKIADAGMDYVVLETTSHGVYQYRTWGITPTIAGVTNITHEHLDYHVTWENYAAAKAEILSKAPVAVINKDDQSHAFLQKYLKNRSTKVLTYSADDRIYPKAVAAINKAFPEPYNQMNARLVYTIAQQLEISNKDFMRAMKTFPGIPGRMQEVDAKLPFKVIVDFAHTPNALKEALIALRKQLESQKKKGKLIAVFGCAGLRDFTKRPIMGRHAAELADLVVMTAEDPRTEDVWSIIRQMKSEVGSNNHKVSSIADRGEAITFAMKELAKPGDIVGIFGKGHEKSMCYGTTEYPWSDVAHVLQVSKEIKKS